jgi:tRNA (mo5U34)-methyltransferase
VHLRHPFEQRIIDIRERVKPEPFDWYSFDSFGNLTHLDALLPRGIESVVKLAGEDPVADIGTGDGDLAFLLESLGCSVVAMDWPGTNANRMLGVDLMKRQLRSSVEIREVELDERFRLDGERFGLVCALGLLYHLKNPIYFLERLAGHARYCLLSTAILSAKRKRDPVAYLAGDREFNDDSTNYWIFSESGILRLLDRCGWDVTHRYVTGRDRDRFFCLAESRLATTTQTIRLLGGWHRLENDAWRWTARTFEAVIENAESAARLELRFRSMREGVLTVQAEINGEMLPAREFDGPGDHVYCAAVATAGKRNRIRVTLSDAAEIEGRELGVIVMERDGLRLTE